MNQIWNLELNFGILNQNSDQFGISKGFLGIFDQNLNQIWNLEPNFGILNQNSDQFGISKGFLGIFDQNLNQILALRTQIQTNSESLRDVWGL